ncbi:MAG: hypothetical protein SGILL_009928 [Bacillariaceae sp.]
MTKVSSPTTKSGAKTAKKKSPTKTKNGSPSRNGVGGPQRILDFILAMEKKTNSTKISRKMVMAASGVKSNTFPVTISTMKNKKGVIDYDKDSVWLTDTGRSKANPDAAQHCLDNETTQDDNIQRFKIGGMALKLFNEMRDGKEHDRAALAQKFGITNKGTYAVLLSNNKKNGVFLVTKQTVQLSDINFPFGRPSD